MRRGGGGGGGMSGWLSKDEQPKDEEGELKMETKNRGCCHVHLQCLEEEHSVVVC